METKEKCFHCDELHDSDYMFDTPEGYVCEECADEHCERCHIGVLETETESGEVVCNDCAHGVYSEDEEVTYE